MPIYDFECSGCGKRFEALVGGVRARPACGHCGARAATRLPAAPRVHGASTRAPTLHTGGLGAQGCGKLERPHSHGVGGSP